MLKRVRNLNELFDIANVFPLCMEFTDAPLKTLQVSEVTSSLFFVTTKSESKCSELIFRHLNSQNRFYTEYQCLCEPLSKLSDDVRVAAS